MHTEDYFIRVLLNRKSRNITALLIIGYIVIGDTLPCTTFSSVQVNVVPAHVGMHISQDILVIILPIGSENVM